MNSQTDFTPYAKSPTELILPPRSALPWFLVTKLLTAYRTLKALPKWTTFLPILGLVLGLCVLHWGTPSQSYPVEVINATILGFGLVVVLTMSAVVAASGGFTQTVTVLSGVTWLAVTLALNALLLVGPLVDPALLIRSEFLAMFPIGWALLIRSVVITALYNAPSRWVRHLLMKPAVYADTAIYIQKWAIFHLPYIATRWYWWPLIWYHVKRTERLSERYDGDRQRFMLMLGESSPLLLSRSDCHPSVQSATEKTNKVLHKAVILKAKDLSDDIEWSLHVAQFLQTAYMRGDVAIFRDAFDALDKTLVTVGRKPKQSVPNWPPIDGRQAALSLELKLDTLARTIIMDGTEPFWARLLLHIRWIVDIEEFSSPITLIEAVRHATLRHATDEVIRIYGDINSILSWKIASISEADQHEWFRSPGDEEDSLRGSGILARVTQEATKSLRLLPYFFDGLALSARQEALEQLLTTCLPQGHDALAPLRRWYHEYLAYAATAPVGVESRDVFLGEIGLYDCPPLMVDRLNERLGFGDAMAGEP